MDFKLTDGQEMLKKTVREFAEKVVGPRAEEVDQTGIFPRDTFEQMAKLGLTGIGTPEEYGGSGGRTCKKMCSHGRYSVYSHHLCFCTFKVRQ